MMPVLMVRLKSNQEIFREQLKPGQLLESLFNSIPGVTYFVKDVESRFVSASLSFANMLGSDRIEDIIGKSDFDFSADFLAEAFLKDDKHVLKTGEEILSKLELVPNDDSLDWVCTSKVPLWDQKGNIVGLAGMVRHIDDHHELYLHHPEMRKIVEYIQHGYRNKIKLSDMAEAAEISVSSMERLFRRSFGLTPGQYLQKTRLNAACRFLRDSQYGLNEIAQTCGFSDQTSMTRSFRQELKITPHKYRQRFSVKQGANK